MSVAGPSTLPSPIIRASVRPKPVFQGLKASIGISGGGRSIARRLRDRVEKRKRIDEFQGFEPHKVLRIERSPAAIREEILSIITEITQEIENINFSREYEKENLQYPTIASMQKFTDLIIRVINLWSENSCNENISTFFKEHFTTFLETLENKIIPQALASRKAQMEWLNPEEDEDYEYQKAVVAAHIEVLEEKKPFQGTSRWLLEFRDLLNLSRHDSVDRVPSMREQTMFSALLNFCRRIKK